MQTLKRVLIPTLLAFHSLAVQAAEPNYGLMAKSSYVAFECSALAMLMKDEAEGKRLFEYAYQTGKTYLKAWQDGKLNEKNNSEAPIAWRLVGGPSVDFILGQISEMASDGAYKDFDYRLENAEQAKTRFFQKNCKIIGR